MTNDSTFKEILFHDRPNSPQKFSEFLKLFEAEQNLLKRLEYLYYFANHNNRRDWMWFVRAYSFMLKDANECKTLRIIGNQYTENRDVVDKYLKILKEKEESFSKK